MKVVLLLSVIGLPLSLIFGSGAALVITLLICAYAFESFNEKNR